MFVAEIRRKRKQAMPGQPPALAPTQAGTGPHSADTAPSPDKMPSRAIAAKRIRHVIVGIYATFVPSRQTLTGTTGSCTLTRVLAGR